MTVTRRDALLAAGTTALTAAALGGATSASATAPTPTPSATATATPTAAPTSTATPTPTAPPAPYPLRLKDLPVRDPFVVTDEKTGHYYLYAANDPRRSGTPGVGTMVTRSRDLQHWSTPQAVFLVAPDLWGQKGGWAPEVHRWRGRWYLFVTVHAPDRPLAVPAAGPLGIPVQTAQFQRGTIIAVADSLLGPFTVLDATRPVAPKDFMTLDGTLFADEKGKPWMVYAHEWTQKFDGTMEAVPLKKDLSGSSGKPVHLFKGSDATWIGAEMPAPSANQILPYVTDGPQLRRLPGGALAMLWSTYAKDITNRNGLVTGHYVQTLAVSPSGKLRGPWVQRKPLIRRDSGHGMLFDTLPAPGKPKKKPRTMLIVHRRRGNVAHAKLYEVTLQKDGLKLGKQRTDLDGGG